jgi:hypothetical protein
MKSQLFKTAWATFRKYKVTFSQALKKAWNDWKRAGYIKIFNAIRSTPQYAKRKLEAKKMWQNCNVDFVLTPRNVVNNDGAQAWYDGKTLNLD